MTAALRCLEARNSRILLAPSGLAVSSISSAMTTTAGFSGVGWKTESPVSAALSARSPIRCRTQRSAAMIFSRTPGSSSCSPAAVSNDSGSQARSSPLPAPFRLTSTASSIAVTASRITSRMLVLPPPVML